MSTQSRNAARRHTPGPWIARKGMSYPAVIETRDCFEFIYVAEKSNALANARLIAAAPELLVACEGALAALILGPHVDQKQAIDYLKEVIAKATLPEGPTRSESERE